METQESKWERHWKIIFFSWENAPGALRALIHKAIWILEAQRTTDSIKADPPQKHVKIRWQEHTTKNLRLARKESHVRNVLQTHKRLPHRNPTAYRRMGWDIQNNGEEKLLYPETLPRQTVCRPNKRVVTALKTPEYKVPEGHIPHTQSSNPPQDMCVTHRELTLDRTCVSYTEN